METILLYALGVIVIVVGVALSIGLHEIGHLVPAKLFGVRVGQYMIGFGPTIFSRKKGETEYGLKAIPLGGYISMAGMYPPPRDGESARARNGFFRTIIQEARTANAATIVDGHEDRVFYKLPVYKRVIIMLGGPFMNLVIALVLFTVVICGLGVQTLSVGSVSACVLPASSSQQTCAATDTPAPGAAAGFKPGDQFLSVAGTQNPTWEQVTAVIRRSAGTPVSFSVLRGGKTVALTATPALAERPVYDAAGKPVTKNGKAVTEKVGFLGIGPAYPIRQQPITAVLPVVGNNVAADFNLILNLPQRLVAVGQAAFSTQARDPNGPISVVGVGRLAGEITSTQAAPFAERFSFLVGIVASLNVALLVFNLIPLLPLDGGHVAGALWESIRRAFAKLAKRKDPGPVDTARLVPLTYAVAVVLIGMGALLIYADIVKPISLQ